MVYLDIHRLMATMFPSCIAVLRSPREFFSGLPPTSRFFGSILLLTAISMLSGFIVYPFYGALMMFLFPVVWIILVIGMLAWSHFLSWAVGRFSESRLVPSNAFLLSAYASVPLVAGFVPWVGLLAVLWFVYLMWLGIVERGRVSPQLAAGLVALPGVLLLSVAAALVVMLPQLAASL
ncbi:MAG: YIP1 family protein [Mariprofundales bacterium]|nr:YIP1 family protein [Mariprofundales bacterium]